MENTFEIINMKKLNGYVHTLKAVFDVRFGNVIIRDFRIFENNQIMKVVSPPLTWRTQTGLLRSKSLVIMDKGTFKIIERKAIDLYVKGQY